MQFQADILEVPLSRPSHVEATVQGATMLAAIGAGLWKADNIPDNLAQSTQKFISEITTEKRQILLDGWHNAVNKCLSSVKISA